MAKKKDIYVAYHEAGHSVIGYVNFGLRRVKKITIIPEKKENTLGHFKTKKIMKSIDYEIEDSPAFEGKIIREIEELFAGYIAEKKIRKRANNIGASKDFDTVIDLASRLYGDFDEKLMEHLQKYCYRRAELKVDFYWNLIKMVAQELLKKRVLNQDDFYKILHKERKRA
jgi:hypothetical protein